MRATLVYPVQLRDYIAQLVLPRDLTQPEADRLGALVQSLVVPPALATSAAPHHKTENIMNEPSAANPGTAYSDSALAAALMDVAAELRAWGAIVSATEVEAAAERLREIAAVVGYIHISTTATRLRMRWTTTKSRTPSGY